MLELVNFTQFWVGGPIGGPVNATTWNTSFHGYGEVMGERYQLCAKEIDTFPHRLGWLRFEACTYGADGVAGIAFIPGAATLTSFFEPSFPHFPAPSDPHPHPV